MQSAQLQIGKLRSRIPAGMSRIRWRAYLERWLDNDSWIPPGLPPSAILLVKKLGIQVSARFDGGMIALPVNSGENLKNQLADVYRKAVRPQDGRVAANAEAILFTDESEMLACVTLAMANKEPVQAWWWRYVLARLPTGTGSNPAALLRAEARNLPAILSRLTDWGELPTVLNAMTADDIKLVIQALQCAYRLNIGIDPCAARMSQPPNGPGGVVRAIAAPLVLLAPPWRKWLPAGLSSSLNPLQELLAGLAQSLYFQPSQTCSALFPALVQAWWRDTTAVAGGELVRQNTSSGETTATIPRSQRDNRRSTPIPADVFSSIGGDLSAQPGNTLESRIAARLTDAQTSAAEEDGESLNDIDDKGPRGKETTNWQPAKPSRNAVSEAEQMQHAGSLDSELPAVLGVEPDFAEAEQWRNKISPERQPDVAERIAPAKDWPFSGLSTNLGGAFYLVNLMHYLKLPECFEPAWSLASRLSAWALLDLMARALLVEHWSEYADDPLWLVLAEMDGREAGSWPGRSFIGNDSYRLPQEWFQMLAGDCGEFYWGHSEERMRLWSDLGFIVVDVKRGESAPERQAGLELSRYSKSACLSPAEFHAAPRATLSESMRLAVDVGLRFWLSSALPFIRFRLRQAMGEAGFDAGELLFVPARVFISATHIDLVASLDAIFPPVRIAGLDRDPGWVPQFGRVMAFHYQ